MRCRTDFQVYTIFNPFSSSKMCPPYLLKDSETTLELKTLLESEFYPFFSDKMPAFFLLKFKLKTIVKKILIIIAIGSALTLIDAFLFFLLGNLNFDFVFDLFHKTFFSFGTYTFNSQFEKIVVLYPEKLFFDALLKIITKTILSSIILLFFSIIFIFAFSKGNFFKFFSKFPDGKNKK